MKEIKRLMYINRIKKYKDKPIIKIITGMRRVGKSTILKQFLKDIKKQKHAVCIYINKEDLKYDSIVTYKDLNSYIKKQTKNIKNKKIYILIDEVQRIEQWEKAVISLLLKRKFDLYLTGSSSTMFSSELSSLLGGRYIEIPIFSLSFNEFLLFKFSDSIEDNFKQYIQYGGLPGIHHFENDNESIKQYLDSIYNTIVLKDIIERYKIKNIFLLENVFKYIVDNIGNLTSGRNIEKYLKSQHIKSGTETILNYLKYFENSYLIYKTERYDVQGKKILEINSKYYAGDVGLTNLFSSKHLTNMSGIIENIVFLHLKIHGYKVFVGKYNNKEIDFIAEKQGKKIYIQITLTMGNESIVKREYDSLLKIKDNHKKLLISSDSLWKENYEGIEWMNIQNFLINFK